jgi:3-deoxy-manno-octulosonate cytidylyltransferase (CMP-KDO synthetase)
MMTAAVVIPVRLGSTRLPGKVLAAETGRPLVQHVVDRVRLCRHVNRVIVAADDRRIVAALEPFGTECRVTSPTHESGTDRVAEVAQSLDDEIIVNVQGDEPEIDASLVDRLIDRLASEPSMSIATAAVPFPQDADPHDPNLVKVVSDPNGRAIYFSRSIVPFPREPGPHNVAPMLHVGVYAYRRAMLLQIAGWPVSPLERTERLEQLRAIEHGAPIAVIQAVAAWGGIDTPEQYAQFVQRFAARHASGHAVPAQA